MVAVIMSSQPGAEHVQHLELEQARLARVHGIGLAGAVVLPCDLNLFAETRCSSAAPGLGLAACTAFTLGHRTSEAWSRQWLLGGGMMP